LLLVPNPFSDLLVNLLRTPLAMRARLPSVSTACLLEVALP
jgi:hypothetical protein